MNKVLDQLSFDIEKGESIAIVGPSGTGKTTLLNIIGTLDNADEGRLLFEGQDLMDLTLKTQPEFRNKKIGMVFQLHHLLPHTLWENIVIPTIPLKHKTTCV